MKKNKKLIIFIVLLVATLVDIFFLPDPIPFIDELVLIFFTSKFGLKLK